MKAFLIKENLLIKILAKDEFYLTYFSFAKI